MLLAAGGQPARWAHAGHRRVGVAAGDLQFDVAVELVEALVAADLGAAGPSSARPALRIRLLVIASPPPSSSQPR